MQTLIASLLNAHPVLTDGAWGTQLQERGLPFGACPDEWNLSRANDVEVVAKSYVASGSRVILTNTFGANRLRLSEFSLENLAASINRAGAEISRQAAQGNAFVFASMGPSGRLLAMGDISESEIEDAFCEQAEALSIGGADALVIETMADLTELSIALRAAKNTGLPVVACMTFDSGAARDRTMMGTTVEDAMREIEKLGADVAGANCGNGIENYVALCSRMRSATSLPLWIKANAGLPEVIGGRAIYSTTPDAFAAFGPALKRAGAAFIGGCCGTTPEHIKALGQVLGGEL